MKMKNLIKSRRGMAIEMAIGVMLLMMAFTIMLLSTAGLQNDHRVDDYNSFNEMVELNNAGMAVLSNPSEYQDSDGYQEIIIKVDGENEINTGYKVRYSDDYNNNDPSEPNHKYEITEDIDGRDVVVPVSAPIYIMSVSGNYNQGRR